MEAPTKADRTDFKWYCRQATDNQLRNIYADEKAARRMVYANIAKDEAARRGIFF